MRVRHSALAVVSVGLSIVSSSGAMAQQKAFPATLAGHVQLPAASFVPAPADAPADLKNSGKFTGPRRVDAAGTVMGLSAGRPTGLSTPFNGQPLQGFSGIKKAADGTYLVITDNGFGSKANSPDHMLMVHRFAMNWETNKVEHKETIFLHDADKKVPFRIVNETHEKRYLTGADFDIESLQPVGDKFWIGDELGPYLIRFDKSGKLEAVFETTFEGKPVRSPDHYAVATPPTPDALVSFNLRRSKGFEGMAQSPDGKFLYPLLEGPLWDAEKKAWEQIDGKEFLRIGEFDVAAEKWTGKFWKYPLEANGYAIGDFNMIDATTGLIIERDNGEGTPDKACPEGKRATDCFHDLPKFKRVYKIEMTDANVGGPVRKIGYIDLLNIQDPNKKSIKPLSNGVLQFPFFTIENVEIVDAKHIIVGNDNNLPFSSSRDPNKADDNEFVLLEVEELLKAK
jgi:hypothetical protein